MKKTLFVVILILTASQLTSCGDFEWLPEPEPVKAAEPTPTVDPERQAVWDQYSTVIKYMNYTGAKK